VLVVPGGAHGRLRRRGDRWVLDVEPGPHLRGVRPSADVLFLSAAVAAGPSAVGVLLTGMGSDGAEGMLAMRRLGGATIAQDEATSVVYGMPAAAARLDAAAMVLPLGRIAAAVLRCASAPLPRPSHAAAGV
jgi:two-component system chemotaxis response regulator CheB